MTSVSRPAAPDSCQVIQSWGSATAATRAAFDGSASRSQRSLVTVSDATGTRADGVGPRLRPPSSSVRSAAAGAERVSFHSSASRSTSPDASSATSPCCWPPTEIAATSSRPPACAIAVCSASHQCRGCTDVPSGCGARPLRTSAPVVGVANDDLAGLRRGVHPGHERHDDPLQRRRAPAAFGRYRGGPRRPHSCGSGARERGRRGSCGSGALEPERRCPVSGRRGRARAPAG